MLSRPHSAAAAAPLEGRAVAVARVLSEVFQPPITVGAALLLSPAGSPGWPHTWWYGAIAALFTCVLPFAILIALVRSGRVVDHHVSERSQRTPVLAMSVVCVLAGFALLWFLRAPASVLAMVAAFIAGIAVLAVVSLGWKISGHASAASSAAVAVPLLFGPPWWPLLLVVPAVCWARVVLRAHTLAQVVAGAVFGPVVIVGLWQAFLAL
ncbi:hypothetical protein GCM10012320_18990 [Sinomonas cellulolyticus]|nr:hypothetical protein GCM10012320_18990 [Sinomonas sp. KCTC 49339]